MSDKVILLIMFLMVCGIYSRHLDEKIDKIDALGREKTFVDNVKYVVYFGQYISVFILTTMGLIQLTLLL